MNIGECLLRITELTQQNLDILQAINESFFAKNTAVQVAIAGTRYNIPSFLALENKVNHLQDAYDNLVHAAQCGEAWLNYDGNTRDIIIQQYNQAPNPLHLEPVNTFGSETIDMFKDMMTPTPYIEFSLNELPDNINEVNVKKVIIYNSDLLDYVQTSIDVDNVTKNGDDIISAGIAWVDLNNILKNFTKGTDYDDYDTIYSLEPRKLLGYGEYEVTEVVGDKIDDILDEYITVTIKCPITLEGIVEFPYYIGTDGTSKIELGEGDVLSTEDGSALLQIVTGADELRSSIVNGTVKIQLQVLNAAYININAGDTLRFFRPSSLDITETDKSLHIPLEEDQYICIFAAPLNSRVRVQSVWGTGLYVNAFLLDYEGTSFKDYYESNVSNIGDVLDELTQLMSPSITKFSSEEYETLTSTQPDIAQTTNKTWEVVQINKHLDESETVQTIRSLYSQKQQLNADLTDVQENITQLNDELAKISFDDLSGTRSLYEAQLTDLKARQNELVTSISKIVDAIALSANNSTVPIENAKFRIRGYVDVDSFLAKDEIKNLITSDDVIGVRIRYRYKSLDTPAANVSVVNDFLFTEWSDQELIIRKKKMSYENGSYNIEMDDTEPTENVPKYNQVDIPITQGETVDIQVQMIYTYGYPWAEVTSGWSEIENVEFPDELTQDVQVLTIIEENNNDIETLRFENILKNDGVIDHVDDKIVDQDLVYFHRPENISSGFYTEERRIIPLRDKLTDMNNSLTEIEDLIKGTTADAIEVSVNIDNQTYVLEPDIDNQIQVTPYSEIPVGKVATGTAFKNKSYGPVQMTGSIKITNTTSHTVYLYSMFPGARTTNIHDLRASRRKFDLSDYCNFGQDKIVIKYQDETN